MYEPVKDGVDKSVKFVQYTEALPPDSLSGLVHNFWELRTEKKLSDDFCLHALPDACVNILFNQADTQIAGVTALRSTYEVLNLGREFHYVGSQFFPGVWQGDPNETSDSFVGTPYEGALPLVEKSNEMAGLEFTDKQTVLANLVDHLIEIEQIAINAVTGEILSNLDSIQSVADMAAVTGMSPRQLQRTLKRSTGFSPHDFLKVLRLQQSFKQHYLETYSDQSHFIHSFRKITGYTPLQYFQKFDV